MATAGSQDPSTERKGDFLLGPLLLMLLGGFLLTTKMLAYMIIVQRT